MKFGPLHKAHFEADDGAYSIVTNNEREKRQLTIVNREGEADVALAHFEKSSIPRGSAKERRIELEVISRNGVKRRSTLALNFAKGKGNELRVYRSAQDGFDYESGDVWFIYRKDGELVVGSMPEIKWRSLGVADDADSSFQSEIGEFAAGMKSEPQSPAFFSGEKYPRNPSIAFEALKSAGFRCEYSGEVTPFKSRATGQPYIEAHHLLPIALTGELGFNLDCVENIVAIHPMWHRGIHFGTKNVVKEILKPLCKQREGFLRSNGLKVKDLEVIYGCNKII